MPTFRLNLKPATRTTAEINRITSQVANNLKSSQETRDNHVFAPLSDVGANPTPDAIASWASDPTRGYKNREIYITGTNDANDAPTGSFSVDGAGKVIPTGGTSSTIQESDRLFAPASAVGTAPTEASIQAWVTANNHLSTVGYTTGTNTATDTRVRYFHVNSKGTATLLPEGSGEALVGEGNTLPTEATTDFLVFNVVRSANANVPDGSYRLENSGGTKWWAQIG